MEKGIFGLKKDPRNPMLFSFFAKEGEEWPSSDSEDSDYVPSGAEEDTAETSSSRKKKIDTTAESKCAAKDDKNSQTNQKGLKNKIKTSKRRNLKDEVDVANYGTKGDNQDVCDVWGTVIPPEILLRIFHFAVSQNRSLPFLCRAARVCRLWRNTATHPSLWATVDLSYGWIKKEEKYLQWLCEHRFSRLESINLGGWANITQSGIECITSHCPVLESIHLSQCKKLNSTAITTLAKSCTSLSQVSLHSMPRDAVNSVALKCLVQEAGARLTHLDLSRNNLQNFKSVFSAIMGNCINLTSLDLSNVLFSMEILTIPIEKFQMCCPNLRNVSLANSPLCASYATKKAQADSQGFPQLNALSVAVHTASQLHSIGLGIDDRFISRMLKTSDGLKLLDARGCFRLTAQCLHELPATDVSQLFLSQVSAKKFEELHLLMDKWQHSIVELDISWNGFPCKVLDNALECLGKSPSTSKLETLDLSGTSVALATVQLVLRGCPKLVSINLTSCRGLPRGMKRLYSSIQEIAKLKEDLNEQHA
ncbi:F-box/LRR-repeat protein 6 [Lingula anatina]|uniref:F-box/LRR-repeat protein 6 n=1 Tax=Lingula anatina TaxID=7574 RepID=A0A1S3K0E8_LINAN|nr:F-box/LRR-repeat protein 6 [Lingula anatina]|eukprot:XP_013416120.1 F-box/LRR-repeat protein 6 [Lingula anatina]